MDFQQNNNFFDGIEMVQPEGMLCVNVCTYKHGSGMLIRSIPLPPVMADVWFDWLRSVDSRCEHSTASIWVFIAIFDGQKMYPHVTFDIHEASMILADPRRLRLIGSPESAKWVSLDPLTHDGSLAVAEHNNWLMSHLAGEERKDFDTSLDWDDIESMLANEIGGFPTETDSEESE